MLNPEDIPEIRDMWKQKYQYSIEDKHMKCALCNVFPALSELKIQQIFEEAIISHCNMKFKSMFEMSMVMLPRRKYKAIRTTVV